MRFISTRKVDNKYFFKTQKEKITQAINLAQFRKAPTVEDFLFDVINILNQIRKFIAYCFPNN